MSDRRSQRSKRMIHTAFIELLKEKPLSDITVAEIARKADIGRGTFYAHYTDVFDLYKKIEDTLVADFLTVFSAVPEDPMDNFDIYIKKLTSYLHKKKSVITLFGGPDDYEQLSYKIKSALFERMTENYEEYYQDAYRRSELSFLLSGTVDIVFAWFRAGARENIDHIKHMERILEKLKE